MLHGLVFGFLPFNKRERTALENQIKTEELDYRHLKKIKNSSIKDDFRRHLNGILKRTSDELIDLVEGMLEKCPLARLDMIRIYEHPWIMRYKLKDERESASGDASSSYAVESD